MRDDKKLLEAKRELYSLILHLTPEETTDNEIKLAYQLCQDKQIQKLLDERLAAAGKSVT